MCCQNIDGFPPVYGTTYVEIVPTPIMTIIDGGNYVTIGQYHYISVSFQLNINLSMPARFVEIYLSHDVFDEGLWLVEIADTINQVLPKISESVSNASNRVHRCTQG